MSKILATNTLAKELKDSICLWTGATLISLAEISLDVAGTSVTVPLSTSTSFFIEAHLVVSAIGRASSQARCDQIKKIRDEEDSKRRRAWQKQWDIERDEECKRCAERKKISAELATKQIEFHDVHIAVFKERLQNAHPNVTALYFSNCNISSEGFIVLAKFIRERSMLTTLDLENTNLEPKEARDIGQALVMSAYLS